jgi:DNA-binding IclR family transcriptional regulator
MRTLMRPRIDIRGESKSSARSGTQSLERAISLLREVSTRVHFGWQLGDIAARCKLSRSTAHRILARLVRERLVVQRSTDRHYVPGPLLFELGLSFPEYGDLQYAARARLSALANCSGGVAFLYFRSGDDFVCAVRAGKMDMKALTIVPGTRRPLVMSAGGAAILSALPPDEASTIARRNFSSWETRARRKAITSLLYRTRDEGLAVDAGYLVPSINDFGYPICDANGAPFASITLSGPEGKFPIAQLPEMHRFLKATAEDLQFKSKR